MPGRTTRLPPRLGPTIVLECAERIINNNPLDAVEIAATLQHRTITVTNPVGNPAHRAAELLAYVADASPVAIHVPGTKDTWTTALWAQPNLVIVRSGTTPGQAWSQSYRYETPDMLASDVRLNRRPTVEPTMATTVRNPLPDLTQDIATAAGITDPTRPPLPPRATPAEERDDSARRP